MALTVDKQPGIVPFEGPRAEAHELEYDVVDGVTYVHFIAEGKQYTLASRAPRSVLAKQAVLAMHGVKQYMGKMNDAEKAQFSRTIQNSVVTVTPSRDGKLDISEKSATYGIPGTRHFEPLHQGELVGLTKETQKNLDEYASLFRLVPRGFRPLSERVPRPGEEAVLSAQVEGQEEVTLSVGVKPGLLQRGVQQLTSAARAVADILEQSTPDSRYETV